MDIRVSHGLGRAEAAQRLRDKAHGYGVEIQPEGERDDAGRVEHETPLGRVAATYVVQETFVEITVIKKPAFLPSGAVRRAVEEALRKVLS